MTLFAFLDSYKNYGWNDYREGYGYKIDELDDLTTEEIAEVENIILKKASFSWPDVEVMQRIKTDKSCHKLKELVNSSDYGTACSATHALINIGKISHDMVIEKLRFWIPRLTISNGMLMVHRLSLLYKSENFNAELLRAIESGSDEIIGDSAALLLFRNGKINSQDDYWRGRNVQNIHAFKDRKSHYDYISSLLESA